MYSIWFDQNGLYVVGSNFSVVMGISILAFTYSSREKSIPFKSSFVNPASNNSDSVYPVSAISDAVYPACFRSSANNLTSFCPASYKIKINGKLISCKNFNLL